MKQCVPDHDYNKTKAVYDFCYSKNRELECPINEVRFTTTNNRALQANTDSATNTTSTTSTTNTTNATNTTNTTEVSVPEKLTVSTP